MPSLRISILGPFVNFRGIETLIFVSLPYLLTVMGTGYVLMKGSSIDPTTLRSQD